VKARRRALPDLTGLVGIALYENDKSIHEVRYVGTEAEEMTYSVRV
jgi:hypothetical protein